MIFIFNLIGLGIIAFSIIALFVVGGFYPGVLIGSSSWFFIGTCFLALDLIIRFVIIKKYYKKSKIKGGTLFFIPLYVWGVICYIIALILL